MLNDCDYGVFIHYRWRQPQPVYLCLFSSCLHSTLNGINFVSSSQFISSFIITDDCDYWREKHSTIYIHHITSAASRRIEEKGHCSKQGTPYNLWNSVHESYYVSQIRWTISSLSRIRGKINPLSLQTRKRIFE